MPATTAFSVPTSLKTQTLVIPENPSSFDNDTPPDWAMGNFSGVWGLNVLGQPLPPAGWVAGYYAFNGLFGRFEGVFDVFNVTNATGAIGGFFLGPFMFGQIVNRTTGNSTGFVGIGGANTTHFYWRIMGILGPTFYMYGVYSKFENITRTTPLFSLP
jgi:hypothetical protein